MNPYNIDLTQSNIEGPLIALDVLYDGMPKTSGCETCKDINGDNAFWCCLTQNPSMYYVEFLKVLKDIGDNWTEERKIEFMLRAVRNYLDNSLSKGCIFYDSECTIYNARPFSCRMYGVIPQDNWDKRWEALKKRQGDDFEAKPQCPLVSASKKITSVMEDKWFEHIRRTEKRIGITPETVDLHDLSGGSYRTFHDHFLLEFFGEQLMGFLTDARMTNSTQEEIDLLIEELRKQLNEQALLSKMP